MTAKEYRPTAHPELLCRVGHSTVELRFRTAGNTVEEATAKARILLNIITEAEEDGDRIDFGFAAWEPLEVREGYTHPADRADAIRRSVN
jgi:hypothetical protein